MPQKPAIWSRESTSTQTERKKFIYKCAFFWLWHYCSCQITQSRFAMQVTILVCTLCNRALRITSKESRGVLEERAQKRAQERAWKRAQERAQERAHERAQERANREHLGDQALGGHLCGGRGGAMPYRGLFIWKSIQFSFSLRIVSISTLVKRPNRFHIGVNSLGYLVSQCRGP